MSDNFEPFATAGSGKSAEEVAFDLVSKLKGQGVWGERNRKDILDMYAECLDATRGLRQYPGQNRVDVPIKSGMQATPPQASTSVPAPQMQAPAQPATIAQPAAAPAMQPVQAQQMQVQQAFKQG